MRPRLQISRPEAAGAGPCGMLGANGKHGKTSGRSCVKTGGLLGALGNLLRSQKRISRISSTVVLGQVGRISLSTEPLKSCLLALRPQLEAQGGILFHFGKA
jgi:hypothetical protein